MPNGLREGCLLGKEEVDLWGELCLQTRAPHPSVSETLALCLSSSVRCTPKLAPEHPLTMGNLMGAVSGLPPLQTTFMCSWLSRCPSGPPATLSWEFLSCFFKWGMDPHAGPGRSCRGK